MAAIAKGLGRSVDFFLWEFPPQDSYMSDVIEFFNYRWPELDEEQRQHLVGLLRMMLREHEVSRNDSQTLSGTFSRDLLAVRRSGVRVPQVHFLLRSTL